MKLTVENFSDISLKPDNTTVLEFCENIGINIIDALEMPLKDINVLLANKGLCEVTNDDVKDYIISCENSIISLTSTNASYVAGSQQIDSISVIQDICQAYSYNVVADVLANNVINKEQYDEIQLNPSEKNKIINEKYLPKVKRWAINKVNGEDFDYSLMPEPTLSKSINPTIINSIVETYIKEYEKNNKDIPFEKE